MLSSLDEDTRKGVMTLAQELTLWEIGRYIILAGAVGGLVNAILISMRGLPTHMEDANTGLATHGWRKWLRDYLVNPILGAVAAFLSWATYGPYGAESVFALRSPDGTQHVLTLTMLSTAIVIGMGGARWLTNESDKRLLKTAASAAQRNNPDPETAEKIQLASPEQAVNLASKSSGAREALGQGL